MVRNPDGPARANIDRQLEACGCTLQDREQADIHAAEGVAVRVTPLGGFADYLLYADGRAIRPLEAKPEGHTLTSVERQTRGYADELPAQWPAHRPLPFLRSIWREDLSRPFILLQGES